MMSLRCPEGPLCAGSVWTEENQSHASEVFTVQKGKDTPDRQTYSTIAHGMFHGRRVGGLNRDPSMLRI